MGAQHIQIGEVAERTGLSLRTIRYYEEMGLVVPDARSTGGFRLYTEADVARLQLVKRMKPLDFTLEETRDLLEVRDALEAAEDEDVRDALVARLQGFQEAAQARVAAVRSQLAIAEGFAEDLARELTRQRGGAGSQG
ncbi:MerR family transcriptional regulator [Nocardioides limicola]|uniref:MerR family transcriptional regulator n=1 Tax=Nocardioides limicola TaxID=2803368 RepID=UPI00193C3202|nr:MerR family transcriptional regulator [Nocardioides sp. DJM-14]